MTSREHARRLMLILLASEGTALRKGADDRMRARERTRSQGRGIRGTGGTEVSGDARERGLEDWRIWSVHPPVGAASRVQ
jgi:hypothetical protein